MAAKYAFYVKPDMMDPSEFFAMLFGNEAFEFLIGETAVALAKGGDITEAEMKVLQKRREAQLAVNLVCTKMLQLS